MSLKTVLAIVGATDTASDISFAIEFATEHDAHLSILIIAATLQPAAADYPIASDWVEQMQDEINTLHRIRQQAEDLCQMSDVSFDVDFLYEDIFIAQSNIGMRAMYSDIVLVGPGLRGDAQLRRAVVAATAFDSRTPLLLVPNTGLSSLKPKNVLVAWNSRPEAAFAAKAALEMLIAAEEVHLVLVDPDSAYFRSGDEPGADIAAFLARHGVKVIVEQLASAGRRTEDVLRQHARELGCDMMVMGAYGHSRLRERIFGGVTASILQDCNVPVFMAR
ncbi:universal stress protein [Rhizobium binae]|uniref:universal stress protein n=1 Tax=Rhizobium binae TaxID=1138190 RepID=UPI001C832774|nr:universal stress protein [Rhizobium binae]MBX4961509.1 universal stress protein [Rhizobium binae]